MSRKAEINSHIKIERGQACFTKPLRRCNNTVRNSKLGYTARCFINTRYLSGAMWYSKKTSRTQKMGLGNML